MDALVDGLIERIERMGRWANVQAGRAFDVTTRGMRWDDRLVLRRALVRGTDRAKEATGVFLTLAVFAWIQWAYYQRFVVGHDTRESLFRTYWAIVAGAGVLPEVFLVFLALVVAIGHLERAWRQGLGTRLCAPWRWSAVARERWVAYRSREIARLWEHERTLMVRLEQEALRTVVEGITNVDDDGPTINAMDGEAPTVERSARRRL